MTNPTSDDNTDVRESTAQAARERCEKRSAELEALLQPDERCDDDPALKSAALLEIARLLTPDPRRPDAALDIEWLHADRTLVGRRIAEEQAAAAAWIKDHLPRPQRAAHAHWNLFASNYKEGRLWWEEEAPLHFENWAALLEAVAEYHVVQRHDWGVPTFDLWEPEVPAARQWPPVKVHAIGAQDRFARLLAGESALAKLVAAERERLHDLQALHLHLHDLINDPAILDEPRTEQIEALYEKLDGYFCEGGSSDTYDVASQVWVQVDYGVRTFTGRRVLVTGGGINDHDDEPWPYELPALAEAVAKYGLTPDSEPLPSAP